MERLKGKIAFISGGARGLGAEMARLLHGEGANVMVTDILEDEGHALANDHENMTFMAHDVLQANGLQPLGLRRSLWRFGCSGE